MHRPAATTLCSRPITMESAARVRCRPVFTVVSYSEKPVAERLKWSLSIQQPTTSSTPPENPANIPGPRAMPRSLGTKAPAFL